MRSYPIWIFLYVKSYFFLPTCTLQYTRFLPSDFHALGCFCFYFFLYLNILQRLFIDTGSLRKGCACLLVDNKNLHCWTYMLDHRFLSFHLYTLCACFFLNKCEYFSYNNFSSTDVFIRCIRTCNLTVCLSNTPFYVLLGTTLNRVCSDRHSRPLVCHVICMWFDSWRKAPCSSE